MVSVRVPLDVHARLRKIGSPGTLLRQAAERLAGDDARDELYQAVTEAMESGADDERLLEVIREVLGRHGLLGDA